MCRGFAVGYLYFSYTFLALAPYRFSNFRLRSCFSNGTSIFPILKRCLKGMFDRISAGDMCSEFW